MSELLLLFLNNLLPIFILAGLGYWVGWRLQVKPRTFSQVVFYLFSPCLIFNLLNQNELQGADILRMLAYAVAAMALVGGIAWAGGRLLRLDRRLLAAVVLTTLYSNAGNLGLPVSLFAFGEVALAHASLYYVAMAVLTHTTGVVIASLGSAGLRQALFNLLKVPVWYAILAALLVKQTAFQLPLPIERSVDLLGQAAIPSMLVLLGLQIQEVRWTGQWQALSLAAGVRMVASPVIGLVLAPLFGLTEAARQAGILQTAMPTAVLTTILATEYEIEPSFVTLVVFATTLLSPFTLTPLLAYLGA